MRAMGLSLFLGVLLLVGCGGGDDSGTPPVITDPMDDGGTDDRCVDKDDDGAGRGCGLYDCDDDDPEVTDDCTRCSGDEPEKNCPCDEGTEAMLCDPENLGEEKEVNGQLLQCTQGARYCQEAAGLDDTWVWTDCVGVFTPQ